MPKAHRKHLEWTPTRLIHWGASVGPRTAELVETILEHRPHPEQGYRSCLGILRLAKQYGNERLEGIRLHLEEGLNSAETRLGQPRIPRQLKSFQMPSEICSEQDDTRIVTWLELKTSDRPGLLSLVGQAFAANRLRLHIARIATAGAEAQDSFAITDRDDQPITDTQQLDAIAASIRDILDD